MLKLSEGKLNIVIDGQFGSTGKGLLSNFISVDNCIHFSISNSGPNAGHTFYDPIRIHNEDKKIIVKHLPISGLMQKHSNIILCAGSIINPDILLKEIEETKLDVNRLFIHPNSAIIEYKNITFESMDSGVKNLGFGPRQQDIYARG